MKEQIDSLYYLLSNPLVTPACLISNVKLANYGDLIIRKDNNGLVATIECSLEKDVVVLFKYFFDEAEFLQRVVCLERETNAESTIFDRKEEEADLRRRLAKFRASKQSFVAV